MKEEEINKKAEEHCNNVLCNAHEKCHEVIKCRDWRSRRAGFYCGYEQATKELQEQIEKMKYALKKIIKTVQNDNISSYGERLVIIYDISSEVLQE